MKELRKLVASCGNRFDLKETPAKKRRGKCKHFFKKRMRLGVFIIFIFAQVLGICLDDTSVKRSVKPPLFFMSLLFSDAFGNKNGECLSPDVAIKTLVFIFVCRLDIFEGEVNTFRILFSLKRVFLLLTATTFATGFSSPVSSSTLQRKSPKRRRLARKSRTCAIWWTFTTTKPVARYEPFRFLQLDDCQVISIALLLSLSLFLFFSFSQRERV